MRLSPSLTLLAGLCAAPAYGQIDLGWRTIDGGGGLSSGGAITLTGTIGQPDAGVMTSATYTVIGGLWPAVTVCYANCDNSTISPVLNVQDFACFLNKFASGDAYANCDGSTIAPVLNVQDFSCFLNKFAAGCP